MPISFCNVGERVIVKKVKGNEKIKNHLKELGFVEGSEVTVMNKVNNSVIVQIKESRIALDEKMASHILV